MANKKNKQHTEWGWTEFCVCVCCRWGCKGNSKKWWSVRAGAVGKHSRNAWTWAYPPPTYWPRKVSHLLVTCGNILCLRKELLKYILKYIYRPEERHWIDMSTPKLNSLILYLEFLATLEEFACNAGDAGDPGSIPGSGRSSGEGHGNPLQSSCLENPMDRRA